MRWALMHSILVGGALVATGTAARGQAIGLGGYGAALGGAGSGSGMSPGLVAPFAGRFGATVPPTFGSGGPIAFHPRAGAAMSAGRTAFTIGPDIGGMAPAARAGLTRRPFALTSPGSAMTTGGRGGGRRMIPDRSPGAGVVPPSFAAPFRPPTNLLAPGATGGGPPM